MRDLRIAFAGIVVSSFAFTFSPLLLLLLLLLRLIFILILIPMRTRSLGSIGRLCFAFGAGRLQKLLLGGAGMLEQERCHVGVALAERLGDHATAILIPSQHIQVRHELQEHLHRVFASILSCPVRWRVACRVGQVLGAPLQQLPGDPVVVVGTGHVQGCGAVGICTPIGLERCAPRGSWRKVRRSSVPVESTATPRSRRKRTLSSSP
eukprot:scaffold7028_cov243-Pinguiococcus_pyrenoidosus.AAC.9